MLSQTVQDLAMDRTTWHQGKGFTSLEMLQNYRRFREHELTKDISTLLHVDLVGLRLLKRALIPAETLENLEEFFSGVPHFYEGILAVDLLQLLFR